MTVIEQILEGINKGRAMYESVHGSITTAEEYPAADTSELCLGDNVEYMKDLLERGYAEQLQSVKDNPAKTLMKRENYDSLRIQY